jgi:purine nucleosidase
LPVTVNATTSGGNIDMQYDEAKRVMQLVNLYNKIQLFKGANGSFAQIKNTVSGQSFDGSDELRSIPVRTTMVFDRCS